MAVGEAYPCAPSRGETHTGKLRLPMSRDVCILRVNRLIRWENAMLNNNPIIRRELLKAGAAAAAGLMLAPAAPAGQPTTSRKLSASAASAWADAVPACWKSSWP